MENNILPLPPQNEMEAKTDPVPNEKKERVIAELSPEWFEIQKSAYHPGKNSSTDERNAYFQGMVYLKLLERVMAVPPMVDEVEILKHYTYDPQCRYKCRNGRIAINRIPEKNGSSFYQLQLCSCAKPAESEYARMEKVVLLFGEQLKNAANLVDLQTNVTVRFIDAIKEMNDRDNKLLDKYLFRIDRHTLGYWIARVITGIKNWRKYNGDEQGAREQVKDEGKINLDAAKPGAEEVPQPPEQG